MLRTTLLLIALLLSAASSAQAQVTIPNTFTDGDPALASEVNQNFQALASAVNAADCATAGDLVCNPASVSCPACPSCPACDTLGSYNEGFAAGGNGVDITSDNAAVCTTAGGTYDAGTDSCSVDITTDNQAVCEAAGGTWDAGGATCSPSNALCMPTSAGGGLCSFCIVGGTCQAGNGPGKPPHCSQCCSQGSIDCS